MSGAGAVWQRARFGTVRPRVQIPGPRPISEYDPSFTAHAATAMDHSWITISQEVHEPTAFSRRTLRDDTLIELIQHVRLLLAWAEGITIKSVR